MGISLRAVARYVRRHHLGLLALMVALSGTAYAASKIESSDIAKKAVKSKHIAKKAVKGKHVAPNAVGTAQVADDSLTGADVDEATLQVTRVVARLRDGTDRPISRAAPPPSTFGHALGPLPSWTQRADEVNDFAGEVVIRFPAGCAPAGAPPGIRVANVTLVRQGAPFPNGVVASASAFDQAGPGDRTVVAPFATGLVPTADLGRFEPGADVSRTLEMFGAASCAGGSTADPVVDEIRLNVIGHR